MKDEQGFIDHMRQTFGVTILPERSYSIDTKLYFPCELPGKVDITNLSNVLNDFDARLIFHSRIDEDKFTRVTIQRPLEWQRKAKKKVVDEQKEVKRNAMPQKAEDGCLYKLFDYLIITTGMVIIVAIFLAQFLDDNAVQSAKEWYEQMVDTGDHI